MESTMLGTAHHKQVLDPVVEPVAVEVVHNLIACQHPAKVLLHKMPMLSNLPPVYRDVPVAALDPASAPSSLVMALDESTRLTLRIKICSSPAAATAADA
jgi:hypothetical protein